MSTAAHFRVDRRLAVLLGESYRSTEQALKELIDNAWDADASSVRITLPTAMTQDPVVIEDDGTGMTEKELRSAYLVIADDRLSRKGPKTTKGRQVKGRKGIGKFAGLVVAGTMTLETKARGKLTALEITKKHLFDVQQDLNRIDLPLRMATCPKDEHGTRITLSDLNQRFTPPDPESLKALLAVEYGREQGFAIYVNGEPVPHEDIPGQAYAEETPLTDAGSVKYHFKVLEGTKAARQPGIVLRVGGKVVGKPSFFGLDKDETVPAKLLRRVVGEIEADGLEGEVTADWGGLIENGKGCQQVRDMMQAKVKSALGEKFKQEMNLARARYQKVLNERLAQAPEYRRQLAQKALEKVLAKFYGESDEKTDTIVEFVLDAYERDEYWTICEKVEQARLVDVTTFAAALDDFGLVDMAVMARQATGRMKFLDYLDDLARNSATLEKDIHKALETNLWVLGAQYSLMKSNVTLAKIVKDYTDEKYTGEKAKKRPDLLLAENVLQQKLLVEFKRPALAVGRNAEAQAKTYRDELTPKLGRMDIVIIGGEVDKGIAEYPQADVRFLSYTGVISTARTQLNWLLKELATPQHGEANGH